MKKYFYALLALLVVVVASCKKPEPEPIVIPEDDDKAYDVLYEVDVDYYYALGYGGATLDMATLTDKDGKHIWEHFGLNSKEDLIKALGDTDVSDGGAQTNQTINYGAIDGSTGYLNETVSTTNGWGHWFNEVGDVTKWAEAYVYAGDGAFVENGDLVLTLGVHPDNMTADKCGKYTIMEAFYDDEITVAVQITFNVTAEAPKVNISLVGTQEVSLNAAYDGAWAATSIDELIDFKAISDAIGIDAADATVYAMNADGSFYGVAATNFWYSVAGDVMSYGSGCGIDINKDAGYWAICNYPDEALAGQTCKGAIVFVNPANNNGFAVKVAVTLSTIDFLAFNVLVSYEEGEALYTLNEKNLAALAAALGVDSVAASLIGDTYPIKAVQADGSLYDGGYTANNGYWFSSQSNVTNWGSEDFCAYVEYRGDYNFGCGLWQESGYAQTVKLAIVNGDKQAVLTFNMTVDEAKSYATTEVAAISVEGTQAVADGYSGPQLKVDLSAIGITAENFQTAFKLFDKDGGMEYTANGERGGFWYKNDGSVGSWGDGGAFFIESYFNTDENYFYLGTGIHPDNVKSATTFSTIVRLANIETLQHITCTVTLRVE